MKIKTDGIVIREQSIKESDKIVTILTRSDGVIHAYAAGAKNIKSQKSSGTGLLTFSQFVIYKGKERFVIDEAHPKQVFMPLRSDVTSLALGQYFCELAGELAPEGEPAEEQLRLILNALYLLGRGSLPHDQIKAVVELRLMALCGFMPDLVCCRECGAYEHERMSFFPESGTLVCGDCQAGDSSRRIVTGLGATAAMRHCIYSDFDSLFSFTIGEGSLPVFSRAAEEYVLAMLGRSFTTLEFYKTIR